MTDRYNSLIVVLGEDIRDDDARLIIDAIMMIKHVIKVEGNITDFNSLVAESRVKTDLRNKLLEALK